MKTIKFSARIYVIILLQYLTTTGIKDILESGLTEEEY